MRNTIPEVTVVECPMCGHHWPDRDALVHDPQTELVGYQASFEELTAGLFLFHHHAPGCGTTFAVRVAAFADLHAGPVFTERRLGQADCPGHCLHQGNLKPCAAACECAWVRGVMTVLTHKGKPPRRRASAA